MNYKKIYDDIINNRRQNPLPGNIYGEIHHIIPKSLGGSNDDDNLVKLSAREHFICHALLAEMYPKFSFEWYKMNHAFMMMKYQSRGHGYNRYFNSRLYELKKQDFSKTMSASQTGDKNSQKDSIWIYNIELKKNLKIKRLELDYYLQSGFSIGRKMNFESVFLKKIKKETWESEIEDFLNSTGILISKRRLNRMSSLFQVEPIIENILLVKQTLIKLYVDEKRTTTDIAEMYNTNNETIRNWFIWFNIERRDKYKPTDWVKYKISISGHKHIR